MYTTSPADDKNCHSSNIGSPSSSQIDLVEAIPRHTQNSLPWLPVPPDIAFADLREQLDNDPAAAFAPFVHPLKDRKRVYKERVCLPELQLMKDAGECSVSVLCRVLHQTSPPEVEFYGIVMPREDTIDITKPIEPARRRQITTDLIALIKRLHQKYRIVHGDIKADNLLLNSNHQLLLCDFAEGRHIDDDPTQWEGQTTQGYTMPDRFPVVLPSDLDPTQFSGSELDAFITTRAPTVRDDLYAMALTIWTWYSGEHPMESYEGNIEEYIENGGTIDLSLITDLDIRETVRGYLRDGGANV